MLTNAVHSIEMGVEDFRSTDPRRLVSAVRNVQAGILLLCKEKLRQISPPDSEEVLIKQRIVPELDAAGQLIFKGQGDKTVASLTASIDFSPGSQRDRICSD